MSILSIDIETFSDLDITKTGVYPYARSPYFEVLLIAYALNDDTVRLIEVSKVDLVDLTQLIEALTDPYITKTAFNANFGRTCLAELLGCEMPAEQWRCTAVHAMELGVTTWTRCSV